MNNNKQLHNRREEVFFAYPSTNTVPPPDTPSPPCLVTKNKEEQQEEGGGKKENDCFEVEPIMKGKQPWLLGVLSKHFLFSGTDHEQLKVIVGAMDVRVCKKGEVIIEEGTFGDSMYVVEQGSLNVSNSGQDIFDILGAGRVFGELGVLYESPRAATVCVNSETCILWVLTRDLLYSIETRLLSDNLERRANRLKEIPEFKAFDDTKIRRIAAVMQQENFQCGDVICRQGEILYEGINDKFYTIASGRVNVYVERSNEELKQKVASTNEKPPPSSNLPTTTTTKPPARRPPPPRRRNSQFENNEPVAVLTDGHWFGEMALLSSDPRSATIVAREQTICFTLSKSAFSQIVQPEKHIIKGIEKKLETRKEENTETLFKKDRLDVASKLQSLDALKIMHVIGTGAYSVVRLAILKQQQQQKIAFALKTMNKQDLFDRNQATHVNDEREILSNSSHPFILSLIKTFQNRDHVFMLFELIQGGELFSRVINSSGGLPQVEVKFYVACIAEGLHYLHKKCIAYRDLKLENLVISSDGYLKIIDFGFAKRLENENEVTRTLCGTCDYLPPESVTRQGHSFPVDCWSLGVLIFEMLTQYSPFADTSGQNNQMTVFKKIIKGSKFVNWKPLEASLQDQSEFAILYTILMKLWDPNPSTRMKLGELKDCKEYFQPITFTLLREKKLEAPWKPMIESFMDTSHFEVGQFEHVKESKTRFSVNQPNLFKYF